MEYALAAYNAGDSTVRQWLAAGDYKDVPEFVESIPYSETRDYVQAILAGTDSSKRRGSFSRSRGVISLVLRLSICASAGEEIRQDGERPRLNRSQISLEAAEKVFVAAQRKSSRLKPD